MEHSSSQRDPHCYDRSEVSKNFQSFLLTLHITTLPCTFRIVRLLLQYSNQLDLNAGDANKNTALHMACEDGNLEIGRLLLEAGADRDALNKWEKTPDQMADPQVAKAVQGLMVAP